MHYFQSSSFNPQQNTTFSADKMDFKPPNKTESIQDERRVD